MSINSIMRESKKHFNLFLLSISFILGLALVSCSDSNEAETITTTDYSVAKHWLALPANPDKEVDVFFVCPTAWKKKNPTDQNIADIDNPDMLSGCQTALFVEASAFATVGNVYAPLYRQADAAYALSLTGLAREQFIGGIPGSDVVAAFDYYIKHYNNGRPFILAGHSQGSGIILLLLSDYMKKNPTVYSRMVAAYAIGYPVTQSFLARFPHMKFAESGDDTGVIISYNTEAPGVTENPIMEANALAINPINWKRDESLAPASENLGSILIDKNSTLVSMQQMNYADAQINLARGVVVCSSVDQTQLPVLSDLFNGGVYHMFDYTFYYHNIRANAQNRVNKYFGR